MDSDSFEDAVKNSMKFDQLIDMITSMVYSGVPDRDLPMHKLIPYLNKENIVRISLAMHTLHRMSPGKAAMIAEEHAEIHKQMIKEATDRAQANQPGKSEEFLNSMKNMIKNLGEGNEERQTERPDGDS